MVQKVLYAIDDRQVSHNDFDDEIVVIHFETGNYYSLRGSAATIWKCLTRGTHSASSLLAAFTDPPDRAVEQIAAFLSDLQARGVLNIAAEGAVEATVPIETPQAYDEPQMEAFEDLQALLIADVIHDTDEQGWPYMGNEDAA